MERSGTFRIAKAVWWIARIVFWRDGGAVFNGRFEHTVDEKGRLSLPARYREKLAAAGESRIMITTSLDPCLAAYSLRNWETYEEKISKLPSFDENVAYLKRIVIAGAVECELDKLGRVQLTQDLRQHANVSREVIWAGQGDMAELWDTAAYKAVTGVVLHNPEKVKDVKKALAGYNL